MKRLLIKRIILFFVAIILVGCTHKGYNDVYDEGCWHTLKNCEREGYYIRIADSIYGTTEMNLQCILDHYKPIDVEIATFMVSKDVDYAKDKIKCIFLSHSGR